MTDKDLLEHSKRLAVRVGKAVAFFVGSVLVVIAFGAYCTYAYVSSEVDAGEWTPQSLVEHLMEGAQSKTFSLDQSQSVRVDTCTYAANFPIEDRHFERTVLGGAGLLLGMVDGHSGAECSQFLQDELGAYVEFVVAHNLRVWEAQGRAGTPPPVRTDSSTLRMATRGAALTDRDRVIASSLQTAFELADAVFLFRPFLRAADGTNDDPDARLAHLYATFNGACAVAALVHGGSVYVANTGDARAVCVTRGPDGSPAAAALSTDHTLEDPTERTRLLKRHADEKDVDMHDRVKGGLQPCRVFGDCTYKSKVHAAMVKGGASRSKFGWHPPYVTVQPDVTVWRRSDADTALVLATDGVWDFLSNAHVASIVANRQHTVPWLPACEPADNTNAAAQLVVATMAAAAQHAVADLQPAVQAMVAAKSPLPGAMVSVFYQGVQAGEGTAPTGQVEYSGKPLAPVDSTTAQQRMLHFLQNMMGKEKRNYCDDTTASVVWLGPPQAQSDRSANPPALSEPPASLAALLNFFPAVEKARRDGSYIFEVDAIEPLLERSKL